MANKSAENVDDLTSRLNQMNVETNCQQQQQQPQQQQQQQQEEQMYKYFNNRIENQVSSLEMHLDATRGYSFGRPNEEHHNNNYNHQSQHQQMSVDEENIQPAMGDNGSHGGRGGSCRNNGQATTLIVSKLDPAVFSDPLMKAKFESLFLAFDEQLTFRYLKSFRRVRLDFTSPKKAEQAQANLNNYKLGASTFMCWFAHIIRPNFANANQHSQDTDNNLYGQHRVNDANEENDHDDNQGHLHNQAIVSGYLNIPKLTRQHLISPPMSPPVGWEPKEESSPCIDVQLLSAIANLVPGQTHEIHAGNESQPGIYVEVCEDAHFDTMSKLSCRAKQLPRTMIPGTPRPEPATVAAATHSVGGQDGSNQAAAFDCYRMES